MFNFANNLLKTLQNDGIKKNFHNVFETSIKLIIDKQFAAIKCTVNDLNATVELLRNGIKNKDVFIAQLKTENNSSKKRLAEMDNKNSELE